MADEIDIITLSNIKTLVDQIDSFSLPHIVHARIVKDSYQLTRDQAEAELEAEYGAGGWTEDQLGGVWSQHHFRWNLVLWIANPQLILPNDRVALRVFFKGGGRRNKPYLKTRSYWEFSQGKEKPFSTTEQTTPENINIKRFVFNFDEAYGENGHDMSLSKWAWSPIRQRLVLCSDSEAACGWQERGYGISSICLGRALTGVILGRRGGNPIYKYRYYDSKPIYMMRSRGVTL